MRRILLYLSICIAIASCKKESSSGFIPYDSSLIDTAWRENVSVNDPVNLLIKNLQTTSFSGEVTAGQLDTASWSSQNNLKVIFPANSLVNANNAALNGNVSVAVSYLKSKGDLIRHGFSSSYKNWLLENHGTLKVSVTQGSTPAYIKSNAPYEVWFVNDSASNSTKYYYTSQWTLPNSTTTTNTWLPDLSGAHGFVTTWGNYVQGQLVSTGYMVSSALQEWMTCGKLYDSSIPTAKLSIIAPIMFTNSNTAAYLVFKDKNIAVRLYSDILSKTFYHTAIPNGVNAAVVTVSQIGNTYYYAQKDITTGSSNNIVTISPQPKTLADIGLYLDNL